MCTYAFLLLKLGPVEHFMRVWLLSHFLVLDLFTTKEDVFEFLVAELSVASFVMLIDHLLDF